MSLSLAEKLKNDSLEEKDRRINNLEQEVSKYKQAVEEIQAKLTTTQQQLEERTRMVGNF